MCGCLGWGAQASIAQPWEPVTSSVPVTNQRSSVPARFVGEIVDGVRRGRSSEVVAAVDAVLTDARLAHDSPSEEAAAYLALSERAWLCWTRLALDGVTSVAFGQLSRGPFKPARVRDAEEAAKAALRCDLHRQILDVAPEDLSHHDWPWLLEAAQQIHVCTRKALTVASGINPEIPRHPSQLYRGISMASDALITAIAAGFVKDGPTEVRETVEAMVGRAARQQDGLGNGG
jgi:hypothetical protein